MEETRQPVSPVKKEFIELNLPLNAESFYVEHIPTGEPTIRLHIYGNLENFKRMALAALAAI